MKHKLTFALIMGMITTAMISFVVIAINLGFNERFLLAWLRSWSVSYVLAVSAMLLIAPRVQLLVNYLLKKESVTEPDKQQA
jgi:cellulose synthase/poly-beta-1,6-N-acetylglucosamine synthase-like glycosyltransferase